MGKIIQPVKGTKDFYPEDMSLRTWLYENIRSSSQLFGYQEYEGPILESLDLYAAKSGEELVKEQAFAFMDKGGDFITLRPELTPTLARMVAQKQNLLIYPLRWWSFGPMWRYERPQKGRTREFFQWNIDIIGPNSPEADAELIGVAVMFLKSLGLTSQNVRILVNNRRLMDETIQKLGIGLDRKTTIFRLIDRKDKMKHGEWIDYGQGLGFSLEQLQQILDILESKLLWQESPELVQLFKVLEFMGIRDFVEYSPEIIRGLDYYTGTVFECYDRNREFRAILAGGRYDNLVGDVGGQPLTAAGFAMGDKVISVVLEKLGKLPDFSKSPPALTLVTVFDQACLESSVQLAMELRNHNIPTLLYPEISKLAKQYKYADRIGVHLVITLGPDEIANNHVSVKNLKNGHQETIDRLHIVDLIQKMLAQ